MERTHTGKTVALLATAFTLALPGAAEDPYIASLGTSGISTGYRMKGGLSRVEVDFQLATTENSGQWRIFGDTTQETTLGTMFYYTGSGVGGAHTFRIRGTPNFQSTDVTKNGDSQWSSGEFATANLNRYTLVTDLKNGKNQIVSGTTTHTGSFNASLFAGLVADLPLSLFGRHGNAFATAFANCAKAKIYGVKIYEDDVLVHDFVPCLKDGETPCFKDLVGGGFIIGENIAAFEAGGDDIPAYQDDAYVSTVSETSGEYLYLDTGYQVKNATRVELDCAIATNMVGTVPWNLMDALSGARFQMAFNVALKYQAKNNTQLDFDSAAIPKPVDDKDVRRTFILDIPGAAASVVTSGFTNRTVAIAGTTAYGSASATLKLACAYGDTWAIVNSGLAPIKIYGCRIYEDGNLVRDFAPYVTCDYVTGQTYAGLRDAQTGSFVYGKAKTGAAAGTLTSLPYGGKIGGEQDAYIESNGSTGISTGYAMKGALSRVEVDFRLVTPAAQKYIYGDSTQGAFYTFLYTTGSGVGDSFKFGNRPYANNGCDTQWVMTPDTKRHTAVTDLKNKKNILTGLSPETKSFASDFAGTEATLPLSIFGKYADAQGSAFNSSPQARIYSVRFYENYVEGGENTPVRELIPYARDGVVGFYDTVTGEIVKNDSAAAGAFTFGGAGTDHGDLKTYLKPGPATKITKDESRTKTLTAYAAGATSYRWYRDGQLVDDDNDGVADGADGVLPITWTRGGTRTETGYRHAYQAKGVFNLYGVEREGEPTVATSVTSIYLGTMLSIR